MRARSMVILEAGRQDAAQMVFVEDHHVVQVLSANRAYDPLDLGVLPR
jgi:predicted nucleic acid-binding protein